MYCIVEAIHDTPVNWDQDVVFYGEIREVEVPMFQIGATYRSKDVDQIIINEANDNRNPEKRLLRGTPVTMKEDVTSEGKFLTTIHIKIYPFGAYYYPWISNRWKAETKHIYTISCLRVLDNAHLKVMDSFLPLGKYAKGFSLHSS